MQDNSVIPVESIRERDIDLLLLEEFIVSDQFIAFFLNECKLPSCDVFVGAWRSINAYGLGETDILVEYSAAQKRIGLLIENKLDACFQPRQAERYIERKKKYLDDSHFDEIVTILVAPQSYVNSQHDFDLTVSYEQLGKYYETFKDKRAEFKKLLLQIACEKLRRGYKAVNSDIVLAFWQTYWEQISRTIPDIDMKRPEIIPDGSDWIELSAHHNQLHITHKLAQGSLDCIGLTVDDEKALVKMFPGAEQKLFKRTTIYRIPTTPIDRKRPFYDQTESIDLCFDAIKAIINSFSKG